MAIVLVKVIGAPGQLLPEEAVIEMEGTAGVVICREIVLLTAVGTVMQPELEVRVQEIISPSFRVLSE